MISRKATGKKQARRRGAPLVKAGAHVSERRLRNGMRVVVAERHGDPVVCVLLFYRVGSRNETEREAGISHFLEHMMFKGSRSFGKGEVDRVTAQLGGSNNAFTGNDHTAYWFEFSSDRWETALDIELDRMRGLLLDPAELDAEREVVLEELAMGLDDPWRVLMQTVESAVFPRHPYGRPIIGYPETLRGMTVESMRDYHRRFYHPGNATLVICGDVTRAAAERAAQKRFGGLPAGPAYAEADAFRPPVLPPPGETRVLLRWPDPGKRLCIAWQTVPFATPDDDALDVLVTALASGRSSRMQRRLVHDRALATSLSMSNDTRVEGGALWVFAECALGTEPEELERAVLAEIEAVRATPITAAELKRAVAMLCASEAFDGETVTDLAEELGEFAVDADWRHAIDQDRRIRGVTAARVRDAAARLCGPERRVVGWSLPR